MKFALVKLLLALALLLGVGAAYWWFAHHLSWGWFAAVYVVGQLVGMALFSEGSS